MKTLSKLALALCASGALQVQAETADERLSKLEEKLQRMEESLKLKDRQIESLENKINEQEKVRKSSSLSDKDTLDALIEDNHHKASQAGDHKRMHLGDSLESVMSSLNIAVLMNGAFGVSDLRNEKLEEFQGGGHDPNKRGFNFQQVELAIGGTVDDLFDYQSHIVFLEDDVELEEAYVKTRALPNNLQLQAGLYLTPFGLVNQQHLHSWDFIDQPIINNRLFGGDGMRGAGVNLSWLTPLPWYSELVLGVQNSDSDNMTSFRGEGHHHHGEHEEEEDNRFEEGIGGRPFNDRDTRNSDDFVWLARWVNTFDLTETTTMQFGLSNLWGENHTGGNTWIYGADLKLVVDNDPTLGRPNWIWQTEIMKRQYGANAIEIDETNPGDGDNFSLGNDRLDDWGLYTQVLKALNKKWSAGLRFEYVTGSGNSFEGGEEVERGDDFDRSDRIRISPILIYQYSEFTKFRLQYNYDDSDTEGRGNTIWFGVEIILGKHQAHNF